MLEMIPLSDDTILAKSGGYDVWVLCVDLSREVYTIITTATATTTIIIIIIIINVIRQSDF